MVDDNPWKFPPGKTPPSNALEFMPTPTARQMGGAPAAGGARMARPLMPKQLEAGGAKPLSGLEFLGKKIGWRTDELGGGAKFTGPPTRAVIERETGVSPEVADAVANYAQWHAHQSISEAVAELRQLAKDAPHFADVHNQRADILEQLFNSSPPEGGQ